MSVLIKGKEMPKNCFRDDCPCCDGENGRCMADKEKRYVYGDRPHWCPLVEVPTPHGRLIDASKIVFAQYYDDEFEEWSGRLESVDDLLRSACDEMIPTIIDPEGTT